MDASQLGAMLQPQTVATETGNQVQAGNVPVTMPPPAAPIAPVVAQREPAPEDRAGAEDSSWIERNGHIIAGLLSAGVGVLNGDPVGVAMGRGLKGMGAYYAGKQADQANEIKMAQEREALKSAEEQRGQRATTEARQLEASNYAISQRPAAEQIQRLTLQEAQVRLAALQQQRTVMTDARAQQMADLQIQELQQKIKDDQAGVALKGTQARYYEAGTSAREVATASKSGLEQMIPGFAKGAYDQAYKQASASIPLDEDGEPVWDIHTGAAYELMRGRPNHQFLPANPDEIKAQWARARGADKAYEVAHNGQSRKSIGKDSYLDAFSRQAREVYGPAFNQIDDELRGRVKPTVVAATLPAVSANDTAAKGIFTHTISAPDSVITPEQTILQAGETLKAGADRQTVNAVRQQLSMLIQDAKSTPDQIQRASRLIKTITK